MLLTGALAAAIVAEAPPAWTETLSITGEEAHAIGVDAYLYSYPLVTMEITRQQLTNEEPGKGIGGPMNTFANILAFPTAEMRAVVRRS